LLKGTWPLTLTSEASALHGIEEILEKPVIYLVLVFTMRE
jgi:hypothetical protein